MINIVTTINEEFFGENRARTYLKDDFTSVLQGVVLRSVIIGVFSESSKARHSEEKLDNGGTAFGDFDPDNAGFLFGIFDRYQKGMMLEVRQLLVHKEVGSGGKFIKDIQKLTVDDFVDFYKNTRPDSVNIPPMLLPDFINTKPKDGKQFIDAYRGDIQRVVDALVAKARTFQDKGYFDRIVKDYEGLEFHKDNYPEKYDIREEPTSLPFTNGKMTIRRRKSGIEIASLAECLNDFAEIIRIYQSLVSKNSSFFGSTQPLDVYIDRAFALFSKEIPDDVRKKTAESTLKHLHKALDIVAWDHRKIAQKTTRKA